MVVLMIVWNSRLSKEAKTSGQLLKSIDLAKEIQETNGGECARKEEESDKSNYSH
jgi:hypothetical protein